MKFRLVPFVLFSLFLFSNNTIAQTSEGVHLSVKAFLQGPLIGTPDDKNLMRDDLRKEDWLPLEEPYFIGEEETISDVSILNIEGNDAIVDWVLLELRTPTSPSASVAMRSALIQRDGDVVDVDGVSPVFFEEVEQGEYYVVIRHRNHLAISTQEPQLAESDPLKLDFSNPDFPVYGNHARVQIGEVMALWAGDVNGDGRFIMQGPDNDGFQIILRILADNENVDGNANHISLGYMDQDIDLDSKAIFSGTGSDRGKLFTHLYGKAFELFGDMPWPEELFKAQIP